jgi:hypothetical protein
MTLHQQAAFAAAAGGPQVGGNNPAFDILGLAEKAAEAVKLLGGGGGPGGGPRMMPGGGMPNANAYGHGHGHGQPPPPPPRQQAFPSGMQQYNMPQQQHHQQQHQQHQHAQQHQQQAPASGAELPITIQYALQVCRTSLFSEPAYFNFSFGH